LFFIMTFVDGIMLTERNVISLRGRIDGDSTTNFIKKNKSSRGRNIIYVTSPGGSVIDGLPDLTVQAKPTDLKQSQVVLVDKTAVQPNQQERVIQVSSSKVLAKPAQLKQGQLVQVPVQNVTAAKQLHQTMEGLSTQKPRVEQRGGSSSDF